MFDVLVFVATTLRRDLLAGVHTILRSGADLIMVQGKTFKRKIFFLLSPHLSGLFLLIAGPGPASSSHGCLTCIQYLQGSETQHHHERAELRQ